VSGNNIGSAYPDSTVDQCKTRCDTYGDGCKGFEIGRTTSTAAHVKPWDCRLQSSAVTTGCTAKYVDFYGKVFPPLYIYKELTCVSGNNIGSAYPDSTVDQCKTRCDTYGDGCKGFEIGRTTSTAAHVKPWDCRLQSSAVTTGCTALYVDFYGKVFPP